jgi:hypothetical protein
MTATRGTLADLVTTQRRIGTRGRAIEARTEAAEELGRVTLGALRIVVADAAGGAERSVRGAWVAGDLGGAVLLDRIDRASAATGRVSRLAAAFDQWTADVERDLAATPLVTGERAGRLLRPSGWAGLLVAAAAGVTGAADVVDDVLGVSGSAVRTAARASLATRAADAVSAEREPFLSALAAAADGAPVAALLRRRSDELAGVTAE